jgi:solute carrier family 25 phosphate transporter 3
MQGLKTISAEEGSALLFKGFTPTLLGYSAQGFFKFGLNEFFKDFYGNLAGQEAATVWRKWIWAAASGTAELFADVALCPLEMIKVKVQTSTPGTFPTGFGPALNQMNTNRGEYGFPFGSLKPLWAR